MSNLENTTEVKEVEVVAFKFAKEHFKITKNQQTYFLLHEGEIYMIAFGTGEKTEANPKGKYCYWLWVHKEVPYGALLNCELKTKFDSIDFFESAKNNAEQTISKILHESPNDQPA